MRRLGAIQNLGQGVRKPLELGFHPGRIVFLARFEGANFGGDVDNAAAVDDKIGGVEDASISQEPAGVGVSQLRVGASSDDLGPEARRRGAGDRAAERARGEYVHFLVKDRSR